VKYIVDLQALPLLTRFERVKTKKYGITVIPYQTHEDHAGHQHARAQPQIAPNVDPFTRSYGMTLRFGQ